MQMFVIENTHKTRNLFLLLHRVRNIWVNLLHVLPIHGWNNRNAVAKALDRRAGSPKIDNSPREGFSIRTDHSQSD